MKKRTIQLFWIFVFYSTFAQAACFQGLGVGSGAIGVSGDGKVVVGVVGGGYAFRWTISDGLESIADNPGSPDQSSSACAASYDGSVIVGGGTFPTKGRCSFRWTENDGMIEIGGSTAQGVSADGSVIVGEESGDNRRAYRWDNGIFTYLEGLPYPGIYAEAVSADGSIIAGICKNALNRNEAVYWINSGNPVGLGYLPGGCGSQAFGVSADGKVIVGCGSSDDCPSGAFRWTQEDGMVSLHDFWGEPFSGNSSQARAVSADGSIIVGYHRSQNGDKAFIWDETNGMRNLQDVLETDYGLDLIGWKLKVAAGISYDGMTIVGSGLNPSGDKEAWIATIPEPTILSLLALGGLALLRKR